MRRALLGKPKINTKHGQVGFGYFKRHIGYDYGVNGAKVLAPESGKVINLFSGGGGGNIIEMQGKYTHRFLHLKRIYVKKGQQVKEAQVIGASGNTGVTTGPHLHHDTRKNGTAWNASFSNYVDWEKLLKAPKPVYLLVAPGKGLADLARRAGYKDWFLPTAWQRISNLNRGGKWTSYNKRLKPGERVRVR